jgi:hypothetical protein
VHRNTRGIRFGLAAVSVSGVALFGAAGAASADPLPSVYQQSDAANLLAARLYYYANGSGPTLTVRVNRCTATLSDTDWAIPSIAGGGWANAATAWRDYSPCDIRFYTAPSYGGTSSSWQDSGAALSQFNSTFNRNVESIKIS